MDKRFQVNEMIGEYRVTSFLGEGGMGEVYLGVHEKLGRPAAIKILHSNVSDESFKTRFFNEARLQASLHHPNIAALYDFQEQGNELLIFMEFVDGESLDDLVARRAFSINESLEVFASVCEAVGYIHQNGIVHRDIKAQNIKLTAAGKAKLLDFGIAKATGSHGLTRTGGVIGTPNYLSPEQLSGEKATAAADVWALGVLLYEMLTGKLPFNGETLGGLVLQITNAQFTPPEQINPGIPREVSNIIKRCLKKEPHGRYQTADELLKAVRTTLGQRDSGATQVGATIKQVFGFNAPAPAQPVATDSSEYADAPQTYTPGPVETKSFPTVIVAAGAGLLLLFVVAVVGIGFWAYSGSTVTNTANTSPQRPAANGVSPQTADLKGGKVRIRIDVDEGKAQVVQNGQVLGTTPFEMDVNTGEKPNLTLRRESFEDKNVQIEAGSGKKVFTFSLKPKS
ncbi:MAG TPA: serine/threonine-protein kinase [Pyrinomonadaceae bacterium]|nr:serine/threonine-protein kinase [Pyrinomonadaceae bacterium]